MARSVAKLKMGFYPLPESEGTNLRQLLSFTGPASVVDPCVGQGVALNLITHGADVRRYGVELDAERALAAISTGSIRFRVIRLTRLPSRSPSRCCT